MRRDTPRTILAAVVVLHLLVSVVHGLAHGAAGVSGNGPTMAFVVIVIFAGPLVGFAWMWKNAVAGARIIGVTMPSPRITSERVQRHDRRAARHALA